MVIWSFTSTIKERVEFNIPIQSNSHLFIQKVSKSLKFTLINNKTSVSEKIYKFVSDKIIDKNKTHVDEAPINKEHSEISKSNYYGIETNDESLTIKTLNNIGFLNRDKLIIEKNSNSLKIHLTHDIPDEISFSQIILIKKS